MYTCVSPVEPGPQIAVSVAMFPCGPWQECGGVSSPLAGAVTCDQYGDCGDLLHYH